MRPLRVNKDASIRREAISEEYDCVIVDDFLQDPTNLVEFAAQHATEFAGPESGYPGLQLLVNDDAMTDIYSFIRFKMSKHFSFFKGNMKLWSYMSMVTVQPDELSVLQRICHTDPIPSPGRTIYAALLYLFENEDLGGTGFYRWKDQELMEQVAAMERGDPDKGWKFHPENYPTYCKPACYMTESNEIADLLSTVSARFNRLIFYWGCVPHSGAIVAPELLSTDVRKGRLTLNCFASVLPR